MIYTNDTLRKVIRRTVCVAAVAAVAAGLVAYSQISAVPSTNQAAGPRQSSDMAEIVITASRHPASTG